MDSQALSYHEWHIRSFTGWDIGEEIDALPETIDRGDIRFFGGKATLFVRALGVFPAFEHRLQFEIRGKNPEDLDAVAFLNAHAADDPDTYPVPTWPIAPARVRGVGQNSRGLTNAERQPNVDWAWPIARHQSTTFVLLPGSTQRTAEHYTQFLGRHCDNSHIPGRHYAPVDEGWPLMSGNPQGWGIMQKDYSGDTPRHYPTIAEIWNWETNVLSGLRKLAEGRATAVTFMNSLNPRPDAPDRYPVGQRPQSQVDSGGTYVRGTPGHVLGPGGTDPPAAVLILPDPVTSAPCTIGDANAEDAITVKTYNGAEAHYISWVNATPGTPGFWRVNAFNNPPPPLAPFNYVQRICEEQAGGAP